MSKIAQHFIKMAWNISKMAQKWHPFNETHYVYSIDNYNIDTYNHKRCHNIDS